ncbi:hypothetical protein FDK38_002754 [Candidozyma auris]|nr:hypothetical protein FDK38_002754 [[Candida] auris]
MSFAESYVLASKVRSKLTREASNPKTSLRSLVLQANMLDNLMDHIAVETEKKKKATAAAATSRAPRVSFSLPEKPKVAPVAGPSITEYEIDYDSASDSDEDDYFDDFESAAADNNSNAVYYSGSDEDESESDSDDYYYSSDEEEEDEEEEYRLTPSSSYRQLSDLRSFEMPLHRTLSVIEEEAEEDMPELARSTSVSDSDSEIEDTNASANSNANANVTVATSDEHLVHEEPIPSLKTGPVVDLPASTMVTHHPHSPSHVRHDAVYSIEHVF